MLLDRFGLFAFSFGMSFMNNQSIPQPNNPVQNEFTDPAPLLSNVGLHQGSMEEDSTLDSGGWGGEASIIFSTASR